MVFVILLPLLIIWGIVDAARRSTSAFEDAGQNKTMWVVLQVVGLFITPLGAIFSAVYLISVRPKIAAVRDDVSGAPPLDVGP